MEAREQGSTWHRHQKSDSGLVRTRAKRPTCSGDNGLSAGEISKWLCRNCARAGRVAFVCQRPISFNTARNPRPPSAHQSQSQYSAFQTAKMKNHQLGRTLRRDITRRNGAEHVARSRVLLLTRVCTNPPCSYDYTCAPLETTPCRARSNSEFVYTRALN